jgi:hypothetical protein
MVILQQSASVPLIRTFGFQRSAQPSLCISHAIMNAGEPGNSLYRTPWTPSDLSSIIEMINAAYEGRNNRSCPTALILLQERKRPNGRHLVGSKRTATCRLLTWQVPIPEIWEKPRVPKQSDSPTGWLLHRSSKRCFCANRDQSASSLGSRQLRHFYESSASMTFGFLSSEATERASG